MSWRDYWNKVTYSPEVRLEEVNELKGMRKRLDFSEAALADLRREYEQYLKEFVGKPDWKRNSILSMLYFRGIFRKEEVYRVVKNYKENYLYTGILQLLVEDALSHDPITNELVELSSDNPELNRELDILQERINVDELVSSIIEDLLSYGEYFLRVECEPGQGVIGVHDDLNQTKQLAVYKGILPEYFLRKEKTSGGLKEVEPNEMLHFCYGYSKVRIEVDGRQQNEFLRMGKPIMWGTFNLLNYLDTLTALVPAMYVQKLNSTSIIGLAVSPDTDPKDALEAAQRYESILNRFTIGDDNEQLVSQILNAAGKFKCVPMWQDHGQLQENDPRWKAQIEVGLFEELRRSIMASIGVPYGFVFGGDTKKQDTLKQFTRYLRKLALIQRAVKNGLVQLGIIHLVAMGKKLNVEDIIVKFTNQIIAADELDKLEFIDTLVGVLLNTTKSLAEISQITLMPMDPNQLKEFMTRYLRMVHLEGLYGEPTTSALIPGMGPEGKPVEGGAGGGGQPQLANAQRQETAQIMKDLQQFLEKHQGAYDKALKVYYGESE